MKFAKELDQDAVPEWRTKYLNYKLGKKKLKAVSRALRTADRTPKVEGLGGSPSWKRQQPALSYRYLNRTRSFGSQDLRAIEAGEARGHGWKRPRGGMGARTATYNEEQEPSEQRAPTERSALRTSEPFRRPERESLARYGSIIGSPPGANERPAIDALAQDTSTLELPNPALDPEVPKDAQNRDLGHEQPSPDLQRPRQMRGPPSQMGHIGNAYEINPPRDVPNLDGAVSHNRSLQAPRFRSIFHPKRVNSLPSAAEHAKRPFIQRVISMGRGVSSTLDQTNNDVALEAYREVDFRQAEFFIFLDKELEKVDSFYQSKEKEASDRLNVLREQLHVMRNQRLEEIVEAENKKKRADHALGQLSLLGDSQNDSNENGNQNGVTHQKEGDTDAGNSRPDTRDGFRPRMASAPFIGTAVNRIDHALAKVKPNHFGPTSAAMRTLGTPELTPQDPQNTQQPHETHKDYVRRIAHGDVPYRVAKRKLKIALAEFYRSLELLKSYSLTNRTAFRKINKKFDKAVNARPTGRYMSEKVKDAYFVNSEVVDGHLQSVEDLYARYFERGNHKIAVNKLRANMRGDADYTGSVWRQAVFATAGLVFGIQGVVYGAELLFEADAATRELTAYLLQIYGGYFMVLLLVGLFVLDCRVFASARVNYQFIFEFDSRHNLDWRQLSEMPAVFLFLFGLTMLMNFQRVGGDVMYIYWPVVLVGLTVLLMFLPAPYFYYRSRMWFLYSNFRLTLAGVYPVEFRDFFLGDMFCSLTYAMGNISLFFCLYANHWNDPPQCNSSHSRLLGFFTTLPGVWRALQCIRRYYDTRNVFPHLVNCGKYTFTILSYMTLSLFRLDKTTTNFALFVLFSTINSLYCSVWDVIMDWSLGDPYAKHKFLRPTLAYKTPALYYFAMVVDPMLRFNWIIFAIFHNDAQHSGIIAFTLAASEVCRRGLWSLFRVENEHCTNMGRFRASRDVPLPYDVGKGEERTKLLEDRQQMGTDGAGEEDDQNFTGEAENAGEAVDAARELRPERDSRTSGADVESGRTTSDAGLAGTSAAHSVAATLRRRKDARDSPGSVKGAQTPVLNALKRVGSTMLSAHAQDYERKRRPSEVEREEADTEDEDEDEEDEVRDVRERRRRRENGEDDSDSSDGRQYDDGDEGPEVNDRPGAPLQTGHVRDRAGTEWASRGPMGEAGEGGG